MLGEWFDWGGIEPKWNSATYFKYEVNQNFIWAMEANTCYWHCFFALSLELFIFLINLNKKCYDIKLFHGANRDKIVN